MFASNPRNVSSPGGVGIISLARNQAPSLSGDDQWVAFAYAMHDGHPILGIGRSKGEALAVLGQQLDQWGWPGLDDPSYAESSRRARLV